MLGVNIMEVNFSKMSTKELQRKVAIWSNGGGYGDPFLAEFEFRGIQAELDRRANRRTLILNSLISAITGAVVTFLLSRYLRF